MLASTPTKSNSIERFDNRFTLTRIFWCKIRNKVNLQQALCTYIFESIEIPRVIFARVDSWIVGAGYMRDALFVDADMSFGVEGHGGKYTK